MKTNRTSRLTLLALLSASILSFIPAPASAVPETVKLVMHYQRSGEDYTGWNVWLWKNVTATSGDKNVSETGVQFNGQDDFGKVLTISIPEMANFENLGFILRLNDWAAKDVDADRFITNFNADGVAEVWIVQGDPTIYSSKPSLETKLVSAKIDSFAGVTVSLNKKITLTGKGDEDFQINGGLKIVSVQPLNGSATSASILLLKLSGDIDLGTKYKITHKNLGEADAILADIMNSTEFNTRFLYSGKDLGNSYTPAKTAFRVWAPTATVVSLVTHESDSSAANLGKVIEMKASDNGTWAATLNGDQSGTIYTYRLEFGAKVNEAVDPYVRATTVNGNRGVVVDLSKTNPTGWNETKPKFSGRPTDALIYELHIRDLSMDKSSGIQEKNRGKFLGLTELNTKNTSGGSTGITAIKKLGVTHVELLPVYDYASVDENNPTFNWGYDPKNYNVPEGSYSTNPKNPTNRITELKSAIQALHNQGLRVNMDVVYNHVYDVGTFSQELIVPGYFFRKNSDGSLANGTGVGNEVASERPMVRKFIAESVNFWADEYNIDGFRFDLMGIMDVTTMNLIRKNLDQIDKTILIIGEGWNMGNSLASSERANQLNAAKLPRIAFFNDQFRDGIKGSVFESAETGFVTGSLTKSIDVRTGIVGNTNFEKNVLNKWTTLDPSQSVSYVESHDNLTLFDKLTASAIGANEIKLASLARYSSSIALLAQGVPFIQAGQEFLRSKDGDSNSYKSSDEINSIKWNLASKNASTLSYFKGLISIRAAHPIFRMSSSAEVKKNLKFIQATTDLIAYSLNGKNMKDSWKTVVVIHNSSAKSKTVTLPNKGKWNVAVQGSAASTKSLGSFNAGSVIAPGQSTLVIYQPN
jgi:pullulanase